MEEAKTMDYLYDEVLNVWGRKLLTDRGYNVASNADITFDLETRVEGCCDDCVSETPIITVRVVSKNSSERISTAIDDFDLRKVLRELVKISAKS